MLISGVFLSFLAQVTGHVIPLSEIRLYTWGAIAFLVIISSIIAFVAYLYALQKLPTGLVSIYAYINPILAVGLGVLLLGEPFDSRMALAAALVFAGVAVVRAGDAERPRRGARLRKDRGVGRDCVVGRGA